MSVMTKSLLSLVAVASLGFVAAGCNTAHLKQLREAASADLHCSKGDVEILTRSGKTRDVEACGQRATYRWEPADGDWRMIGRGGAPGGGPQPVMKAAPGVAPAQPAPVMTATSQPTGTPSQPPPSSPAPGGKSL
jgi:hypothetical protein